MTKEEYEEIQRLMNRIEQGGNDGADIYDYEQYAEMLFNRYGKSAYELAKEYESSLRNNF